MLECFDLTGKVAMITGGSQGLGRAFARAFAKSGANLCIISRTESKLIDTQKEIEGYGVHCIYCVADISDPVSIQAAVDKTIETFGRIDCLINNACHNAQHFPLESIPLEEFEKCLDVNVMGTLIVSQIVVKQMIKQKSGKIVNIASIAGQVFHGMNYPGAYETAKDGIKALTRAMANNWCLYGINVNAIAPGYFLSDANQNFCKRDPSNYQRICDMVPMKRWGEPDEIGPLGVFLCSDAASYMQGSIVTIDGGRTFK